MKVTVYFGNVRVIVPCGQGDILVRELMDLAITRYKKATGKSQSSEVIIHNLRSSRDDGILYPDDQLNDVADDREQIIAEYEESYSPLPHLNCGDITSTSSICTGSPDLFSVEVGSHCSVPYNSSDVEITEDPYPMGVMTLQVRRGSEPALNCLFPASPITDPNKRWSTAVVINALDARESSPDDADFNENFTLKSISYENCDADAGSDTSSMSDEREMTVILKNESGPLGIHVVPDYDSKGRDMGLVIQGIEAGGRIDRDGRFHVGDRITEINGKSLQNVSFQSAQEIFKSALKCPQIKLELVRSNSSSRSKIAAVPKKPPPPVYPKSNINEPPKKEEEASLVEGEERAGGVSTKVATVTPTKKIPSSATRRLASANTRKIGRMLTIELTKGSSGLGFSITTRDNPAGGNSPIYIKNVLPKGAAIEDGRLQPGDRLLEVDDITMTGKTQPEAVSILRNIPLGKAVQLVVSRQDVEECETMENENEFIPSALDEEAGIFPWKHREILTFQIPLKNSHSSGLGVSVKGKSTSTANGSVDLGIFIKSVIPGGAASKDGRLQTNDQLVNINGISLLGMSNSNAMETLRNAMMQSDGPIRNAIILTIARRIFQPLESNSNNISQKTDANANKINSELNSAEASDAKERLRNISLNISRTNQIVAELDTQHKETSLPGCNPVIERLTGKASLDVLKGITPDIYGYVKQDSKSSLIEKTKAYSATLSSSQNETIIIEGEYDPTAKKVENQQQLSNGLTKPLNAAPAGSQLSLDESNPGFSRDGFGRQSMSEKRHAQLDARSTDTYQRTKKAREDKDRQKQDFDEEYLQKNDQGNSLTSTKKHSESDEVLGPSLGLRKSSSLESLQTMIQELNKDDESLKRAYQSRKESRSSRSRGCNESFRAAVDRSYDAPSSVTMETLDEESESGSSVCHVLVKSAELPDTNQNINIDLFQDDLLSMYCRNSKSTKKKSLLKGLGSVFKFGKNRKQSQDLKGTKDGEIVQDDVFQLPLTLSNKDQDGMSDVCKESDVKKNHLPQIPVQFTSASSLDSMPNRQERMQSLREQHQRLHQKRQGHYPLDQKEEYYENELKEKESKYVVLPSVVHGRSHSLDICEESAVNAKMPPFNSDTNRYSHYMNYKEIQEHITQRVHHDHIRSSTIKVKSDSQPPSSMTDYPSTNLIDYESVHHLQRHESTQSSEISCNSLPRSAHSADHILPHTQVPVSKSCFIQDSHEHGNYGHMNVYHFYPSNKLYSHIIPGSKV